MLKIKTYQGGYDKNFSYLLWCEKSKHAAIIDPAVNPNSITEYIEKENLILSKIMITHSHYDHIKYLDDFIYYYPNIQICCHEESKKLYSPNNIKSLGDNEVIMLGEILIISIFTPGHYHDSICYWIKNDNLLFTGDTMFVGRTGRTISNTSNISELYDSIYEKIFQLPENTKILPGHHYGYIPSITIKENKSISAFFQCNSLQDFKKIMAKFEENYKKK